MSYVKKSELSNVAYSFLTETTNSKALIFYSEIFENIYNLLNG